MPSTLINRPDSVVPMSVLSSAPTFGTSINSNAATSTSSNNKTPSNATGVTDAAPSSPSKTQSTPAAAMVATAKADPTTSSPVPPSVVTLSTMTNAKPSSKKKTKDTSAAPEVPIFLQSKFSNCSILYSFSCSRCWSRSRNEWFTLLGSMAVRTIPCWHRRQSPFLPWLWSCGFSSDLPP